MLILVSKGIIIYEVNNIKWGFVTRDIGLSTQSSVQGTAVGYRSAQLGGRQTHPHNEEPE